MQPYPTYQNYMWPYQAQANQDRIAQLQGYQQQMQPQAQATQVQQTPPQTNQGLIWVQGEAAARSYLVAPSTTVLLMDSESQHFYLKSADAAGMPSLRIFEYSEVKEQQAPSVTEEDLSKKYVTRQEYLDLIQQYDDIKRMLTEQKTKKTTTRAATKEEATE